MSGQRIISQISPSIIVAFCFSPLSSSNVATLHPLWTPLEHRIEISARRILQVMQIPDLGCFEIHEC